MDRGYFNIITQTQKPSAWVGHEEWAISLVEAVRPTVTIDLGVDYGFSTFSFAYPKMGHVYGIDWFKGDRNAGFRNTYYSVMGTYEQLKQGFGINNITFIASDFRDAAVDLKKKLDAADIIHIDGEHSYESVSQNFHDFSAFFHEETVVLFHDTLSFPGTVGRFFQELDGFKLNRKEAHGLGIWTRSETMFNKLPPI